MDAKGRNSDDNYESEDSAKDSDAAGEPSPGSSSSLMGSTSATDKKSRPTVMEESQQSSMNTMAEALSLVAEMEQKFGGLRNEIRNLKGPADALKLLLRREEDGWSSEKKTQYRTELLNEQIVLERRVNKMKKTLVQTYQDMSSKDEEIRVLTKKIAERRDLKEGTSKSANSMKSRSCPDGVEHVTNDFIPEFPKEVWEVILGKVTDAKDMWNLCNACELFDTILQERKSGYLLEQALPYLHQYLPGDKLLKCRTICKSWKVAVDSCLEDHPSQQPHQDKNDPRHLNFKNPMKEKQLGEKYHLSHQMLKEYFKDSKDDDDLRFPMKPGQNPFIGRSVVIDMRVIDADGEPSDGDTSEDEEVIRRRSEIVATFWKNLHKFLTIFGKDIWYVTMRIPYTTDDDNKNSRERMILFSTVGIFHQLPNLRKLSFEGNLFESRRSKENVFQCALAPNLESLGLNMTGYNIFPAILIERYHSQLKWLEVEVDYFKWGRLGRYKWPNLVQLNLNNFLESRELGELHKMRMPNLKKLALNMGCGLWENIIPDLLELIQALSSTTGLTQLRLVGNPECLQMKEQHLELRGNHAPATLKTIEVGIDFEDNSPCYTFLLLCFPFVENLSIFQVQNEDEDEDFDYFSDEYNCYSSSPEDEYHKLLRKIPRYRKSRDSKLEILEVNKYANGGSFYDSNIWELLPKLKVFTFEKDVYTRHCYEEHVNRKKIGGWKNLGGD